MSTSVSGSLEIKVSGQVTGANGNWKFAVDTDNDLTISVYKAGSLDERDKYNY